ncbi:MAG: ABC transporter ATP-binding protein [Planctomycetes bacterium]|nr:ABC transporter ATP-binding protein [Planctomycetota bacterium]NOG55941.1 ABC transporter ATP-binding protein [Planctomycetota bacterium]
MMMMMMMMASALTSTGAGTSVLIQDVSFAYATTVPDGFPVLSGITARLRPAAVTAVLGPNAAGKTTLLLLMAGLLKPQSGRLSLVDGSGPSDGQAVHDLDLSERARVLAYVAQRPRVDAPFSVRQVVELGRFATGPSEDAVKAALRAVEIEDLQDRLFHELSVGQQQRVSLARAVAQLDGGDSGPVFLLDEPMSAMDPKHALHTAGLLKSLAVENGATVVVVLHDLVTASRVADDVLLLNQNGTLAGHGGVSDMLTCERLESVYEVPFVRVSCPGEAGQTIPVPVARRGTST